MSENAAAPAANRGVQRGDEGERGQYTPRSVATNCACQACADLLAECGEHFALYSRKLLIRSWAGVKSPAERAYVRAHRSEAQQAAAMAAGARMNTVREGPQTPSTDGETGGGGGSGQIAANPALTARVVAVRGRGAA